MIIFLQSHCRTHSRAHEYELSGIVPCAWNSYGVGLLGALAYIRMLGNSVDGLAANSARGAVRYVEILTLLSATSILSVTSTLIHGCLHEIAEVSFVLAKY